MKRFMSGFLLGAILFGVIGAVAVSYIANPVDFKVLVNGKEFISDPPALEVEGRTYLPLRAMGEALGVPVNWNEELRQAEVGATSNGESEVIYEDNLVKVSFLEVYELEGIAFYLRLLVENKSDEELSVHLVDATVNNYVTPIMGGPTINPGSKSKEPYIISYHNLDIDNLSQLKEIKFKLYIDNSKTEELTLIF